MLFNPFPIVLPAHPTRRRRRPRGLNVPLPPMRPVGERHLSPFYSPAPHSNKFTDPDFDYQAYRRKRHGARGDDEQVGGFRKLVAHFRRVWRSYRGKQATLDEALDKARVH